jgi:hypothetical protein
VILAFCVAVVVVVVVVFVVVLKFLYNRIIWNDRESYIAIWLVEMFWFVWALMSSVCVNWQTLD